jgi:hypothetical protein
VRDAELPALALSTVEDDDDLWAAIDVLVYADASASRRLADIDDWVDVLSACIDDEGVLRVGHEVRVRVLAEAEELALAIARWAFAEGRRHAIAGEEGRP